MNKFRRRFIQMAVKDRAEKSNSYGRYFERDGRCIVEKIVAVFKSRSLQIFNWVVR